MIRVARANLPAITRRLAAGTPTTVSRWGDGEWRCILGYSGENCDGHPYSSQLRADLTRVLESRPTYFLGMQPFAVKSLGEAIDGWLTRRHLRLDWINADVFHQASIEGKLDQLIDILRQRAVLVIGPSALHPLPPLPRAAFLSIPAQNCYASYADTLARAQTIVSQARAHLTVAISAGMMANVLIHDLHSAYPQHSYLDFGSLWDPYVGVVSRKYHKKVIRQLAQPQPCA